MNNYTISEEQWDLHRKGQTDQERHKRKVKEAIENALPELVSEESIIMSNGQHVTRLPIRSLDEYKIRYQWQKSSHVGQGNGDSKVGDIIARGPKKSGGQKDGTGGGDQPGIDYEEADVSLVDIEEALFNELALPVLDRPQNDEVMTESIDFRDIRKKGLLGNIDKRRTILSAIKRHAEVGETAIHPIIEDDLRFKTWDTIEKPDQKAVVMALMDTSGSMGQFEKIMARSFFFWMTRFLYTKYEHVTIEFIAHHTSAKRVSEEAFFSKGESGGTICSSAYQLALDIIEDEYATDAYTIYPIHFSDGDNLTSDNKRCVEILSEVMKRTGFFAYGEINPYSRQSTLMTMFNNLQSDAFHSFILKQKKDVYYALKHFFPIQEN